MQKRKGNAVYSRFYKKCNALFLKHLPDKVYLKLHFRLATGYPLNLKNPQTLGEKLVWLKLYDRKSVYPQMVDKQEVRKYVADKVGEKYLIPLLGVWDCFEDINFEEFPNQFVLKPTHDSGSYVICKDKKTFSVEAAKEKLSRALKKNFFYEHREWPYKDLKPKIIAEHYLGGNILDYQFICTDGEVRCCAVLTKPKAQGEFVKMTFYDNEWKRMPLRRQFPVHEEEIKRPEKLNEMLWLAETFSKGIPFLRVDLYEVDGCVYFGELTLYPGGGAGLKFEQPEHNDLVSSWITLPERTKKN